MYKHECPLLMLAYVHVYYYTCTYVTQGLKTRRLSLPTVDIELEAKIGESSFRVCNSSIQLVSVN